MNKKELLSDFLKNFPELEKDEESLKKALDFLVKKNPDIVVSAEFKKRLGTRLRTVTQLKQGEKPKNFRYFIPIFGGMFMVFGMFFMISNFITLDQEDFSKYTEEKSHHMIEDKSADFLIEEQQDPVETSVLKTSSPEDISNTTETVKKPKNNKIQPKKAPIQKSNVQSVKKDIKNNKEKITPKKDIPQEVINKGKAQNTLNKNNLENIHRTEQDREKDTLDMMEENIQEYPNQDVNSREAIGEEEKKDKVEDNQLFQMLEEEKLDTTIHPRVHDEDQDESMENIRMNTYSPAGNTSIQNDTSNFERICKKYGGEFNKEKSICTKKEVTCNYDNYIAETCPFFDY